MPDPTISHRQEIRDDIVANLKAIAQVDGYFYDINDDYVSTELTHWEAWSSSKTPALFVVGGDEAPDPRTNQTYESEMTVVVWGYVHEPGSSQDALDKLVHDVIKKLMEDIQRNCWADFTQLGQLTTDEGNINVVAKGWALFRMEILVQYDFFTNNP